MATANASAAARPAVDALRRKVRALKTLPFTKCFRLRNGTDGVPSVRAISDAEHESVPPMSLRGAMRRRKGGRFLRWAVTPRAPLEAFNFIQGGRRARHTLRRAVPAALDVAARLTADIG